MSETGNSIDFNSTLTQNMDVSIQFLVRSESDVVQETLVEVGKTILMKHPFDLPYISLAQRSVCLGVVNTLQTKCEFLQQQLNL